MDSQEYYRYKYRKYKSKYLKNRFKQKKYLGGAGFFKKLSRLDKVELLPKVSRYADESWSEAHTMANQLTELIGTLQTFPADEINVLQDLVRWIRVLEQVSGDIEGLARDRPNEEGENQKKDYRKIYDRVQLILPDIKVFFRTLEESIPMIEKEIQTTKEQMKIEKQIEQNPGSVAQAKNTEATAFYQIRIDELTALKKILNETKEYYQWNKKLEALARVKAMTQK